jgi:hypothetical protein
LKEPTPDVLPVSIALLHYPVYDRNGRVVATAITNLDIHDLARLARTFDLFRYYVVTPVDEQRELAERIRAHWREGWGGSYNPDRKEALQLLRVTSDLDEVLYDLEASQEKRVTLVATGAGERSGAISYEQMRDRMQRGEEHFLMLFGTGWGLADELFDWADCILEPVKGSGGYNHLSVRCAAAIIMDRLLGRR